MHFQHLPQEVLGLILHLYIDSKHTKSLSQVQQDYQQRLQAAEKQVVNINLDVKTTDPHFSVNTKNNQHIIRASENGRIA